jgi:hypothetical protein
MIDRYDMSLKFLAVAAAARRAKQQLLDGLRALEATGHYGDLRKVAVRACRLAADAAWKRGVQPAGFEEALVSA